MYFPNFISYSPHWKTLSCALKFYLEVVKLDGLHSVLQYRMDVLGLIDGSIWVFFGEEEKHCNILCQEVYSTYYKWLLP